MSTSVVPPSIPVERATTTDVHVKETRVVEQPSPFIKVLQQISSVDLRSLALLRILVAAHLLVNTLKTFPTQDHPLDFAAACLLAVSSIGLMIGHFTTVSSLSCLILSIWYIHSAQPLTWGLLFFGMLSPWGVSYSFDSALNNPQPPVTGHIKPKRVSSSAGFGLMMDVATFHLVWAVTNWLQWRKTYELESWLLLGSFFSLLSLPSPVRTLLLLFAAGAEVVTASHLNWMDWTLALISTAAFVPSDFWDKIFDGLNTPERRRLTIYYDNDYAFDRKMALWIRTFFLIPQTQLRACQESPSMTEDLKRFNSWIVVDSEHKKHVKFDALATVIAHSPLLWWMEPFMRTWPVAPLGDFMYSQVAFHRQLMNTITSIFPWRPTYPLLSTNLSDSIATTAIIASLLFRVGYMTFTKSSRVE